MRLISLKLEQIRSYTETTITFPDHITLLSGDIGSGKSTLLMAIEFALFGISRGELSGATLLRHGAQKGSVQLTFATAQGNITIERTLKRGKNGVSQESGWIEQQGQREQLTPTELKARVYDILGYPQQSLNKKNLLYRFTIYTPQEEMKAILTQPSEERVETLRRIFGVDAYKRMRENAQQLHRSLRQTVTTLSNNRDRITEERTLLMKKLEQETEIAQQLATLKAELTATSEQYSKITEACANAERNVATLEAAQQHRAMQLRTQKLLQEEIARMIELKKTKQAQLTQKEATLKEITEKLKNLPELPVDIVEKGTSLATALKDLHTERGKFLAKLEETGTDIEPGTCPTCQQPITETHIHTLKASLAAQHTAVNKRLEKLREQEQLYDQQLKEIEQHKTVAATRIELIQRSKLVEESLKDQGEDCIRLGETITAKQQELTKLVIPPPITDTTAIQALKEMKQQLLVQQERLQVLQRKEGTLTQQQRELTQVKAQLATVDEQFTRIKKQETETKQAASWLVDQFIPFTSLLERHVLLTVHTIFDSTFRQWFLNLVDDEVTVQLDQSFSPILQQYGYDIELHSLSGGERTAVALAYRLALVHTIHTLLPDLGTAGLILLDEPTDGFSAEQLTRMRDVLVQLAMDQVLIVSHEQQLEGFVDHILRIEKHSGVSDVTEAL